MRERRVAGALHGSGRKRLPRCVARIELRGELGFPCGLQRGQILLSRCDASLGGLDGGFERRSLLRLLPSRHREHGPRIAAAAAAALAVEHAALVDRIEERE